MSGGNLFHGDLEIQTSKNTAHWSRLFGNHEVQIVHEEVALLFSECLQFSADRSTSWASRFVEAGLNDLKKATIQERSKSIAEFLDSRSPAQMATLFNHTFELSADASMKQALEVVRCLTASPSDYFQKLGRAKELTPLLLFKMFTTIARSDPDASGMEEIFTTASKAAEYFHSICVEHRSEGGPSFEEFSLYFVRYHVLSALHDLVKVFETFTIATPAKPPPPVVNQKAVAPPRLARPPARGHCPPPGASVWPPPFSVAHEEEIRRLQFVKDNQPPVAGKSSAPVHVARSTSAPCVSTVDYYSSVGNSSDDESDTHSALDDVYYADNVSVLSQEQRWRHHTNLHPPDSPGSQASGVPSCVDPRISYPPPPVVLSRLTVSAPFYLSTEAMTQSFDTYEQTVLMENPPPLSTLTESMSVPGVPSCADPTLEPQRLQLVPTSKTYTLDELKTHSSSSDSFFDEPAAEFEISGIYISQQSHTESFVVDSRFLVTSSSRSSYFVPSLKKGLGDHSRQVVPRNVHYGVSSATISSISSSKTLFLPRHVGFRESPFSLSNLKVNDPILAAFSQSSYSIWPPFYGIFWQGVSENNYCWNVLTGASKHLPVSDLPYFFAVSALHMFQVADTWLHCSENFLSAGPLSVCARFWIGYSSLVSSCTSTSLLHLTGWNAFLIKSIQLASGNLHLRIVQKSALLTHPPVCPSPNLSLCDYSGSGLDSIVAAVSDAASDALIARSWSPTAASSTVFSATTPSTSTSWVYQPGTGICIAGSSTVLAQHKSVWEPLFCFLQQVVVCAFTLSAFVSALSGRLLPRLLPSCYLDAEAGPAMFCSGNLPPVRLPRPKPEEAVCTHLDSLFGVKSPDDIQPHRLFYPLFSRVEITLLPGLFEIFPARVFRGSETPRVPCLLPLIGSRPRYPIRC